MEIQSITPVIATAADEADKKDGEVVIVTDMTDEDTSLKAMVDRFTAVLPFKTKIVNP